MSDPSLKAEGPKVVKTSPPTILICSAGRRNYLVRWFREALETTCQNGQLIVADVDPSAPARSEATQFQKLPPIDDETYVDRLIELCLQNDVDLALSLNDFELSLWSSLRELDTLPTVFLRMSPQMQTVIEDKQELARYLPSHGLLVPQTVTGLEALGNKDLLGETSTIILKNRYGSGSSGLTIAEKKDLEPAIDSLLLGARNRLGGRVVDTEAAAEAIVIQPYIQGLEHGLDIVTDFDGKYRGTLARQKHRMSGGETSRATTVPCETYDTLGRKIANAIRPIGTIDVDVLNEPSGRSWVIDINPRFGGGYPFNHVAGANIPLTFTNWILDKRTAPHLEYEAAVTSAKYIDIVRVPSQDLSE